MIIFAELLLETVPRMSADAVIDTGTEINEHELFDSTIHGCNVHCHVGSQRVPNQPDGIQLERVDDYPHITDVVAEIVLAVRVPVGISVTWQIGRQDHKPVQTGREVIPNIRSLAVSM